MSHEPSQLKPGGRLCTRLPWRSHLGCWWEGLLQHNCPTHIPWPRLGTHTWGSINSHLPGAQRKKALVVFASSYIEALLIPSCRPQAASMANEGLDNMMNSTQTLETWEQKPQGPCPEGSGVVLQLQARAWRSDEMSPGVPPQACTDSGLE